MTITEATHALARRIRGERAPARPTAPAASRERQRERPGTAATPGLRLVDVMARVEPSWVEAVAVVQAVCAQLPPGHAAPSIDTIVIQPSGAVSFAPTAPGDDLAAVRGTGQLLNAVLRHSGCPMPVWDAAERAVHAPDGYATPQAFAAALTAVPAAEGVRELQQFYRAALAPAAASAGVSLAAFGSATAAAAR